jgi:hypothetical protein
MGTGGVVALKFVIYLRGRFQFLLQAVGAHQRRGAVHLIKIPDLAGYLYKFVGFIQLLVHQFAAEQGQQIFPDAGLARARVQHRVGLLLHNGAYVVPMLRELLFGKVNLVRY